jgi:uncharacterized protein (DUF488 family)
MKVHARRIGEESLDPPPLQHRWGPGAVRCPAQDAAPPTVPRSRTNPQFNQDTLPRTLARADLRYVHLPRLGGLRRTSKDSPNTAWRNASFRGYADYMQTDEFARGLEELRELTEDGPLALMCAEAVRWRCHRSLVADALFARGVEVLHITRRTRAEPHKLTPFAELRGAQVLYPGPYEGEARR